ncbi:MAG: hypothetical protein HY820_42410 [Acidobacteria bacterium]|nr:hypothetical protein [Acidobacteriota bacterium]
MNSLIIAALAVLLASTNAAAQDSTLSISVHVRDTNGNPLGGIPIAFTDQDGSNSHINSTSPYGYVLQGGLAAGRTTTTHGLNPEFPCWPHTGQRRHCSRRRGGAVSIYASSATHVVLDINGYFAP